MCRRVTLSIADDDSAALPRRRTKVYLIFLVSSVDCLLYTGDLLELVTAACAQVGAYVCFCLGSERDHKISY